MRAYHCFVTGMVIELLVGHGGGGELQGCEEYCVACQEEARCSDARPRRPQGAAPGRVRRAHSILKPGPPKKCGRRAAGGGRRAARVAGDQLHLPIDIGDKKSKELDSLWLWRQEQEEEENPE